MEEVTYDLRELAKVGEVRMHPLRHLGCAVVEVRVTALHPECFSRPEAGGR